MEMTNEVESMKHDKVGFLLTFIVLLGFWLLLSKFFDPVHVSLGIICSALVAFYSHDLLIEHSENILSRAGTIIRFIRYVFWIIRQIILANIDVARIVLNPKLPISPQIIKFDSKLRSSPALTTLANSITLTPGTLTVDIIDGEYYVHCLAVKHGDKLLEGTLERNVRKVFKEGI